MKKRNKTLITIFLSLLISVSVVYAADKVFNIYGNYIESPNGQDENVSLGSGTATPFCSIDDATTTMCSVAANRFEVANATWLQGTTTIDRSLDGFYVSGNLSTATGSATSTRNFSVKNTGKELLCGEVIIRPTTGAEYFGSSFTVGTITWLSSFFELRSLIASTTIATNTTPILTKTNNVGTNGTAIWPWKNGDYVVGTWGPDSAGLEVNTSTDKDDFVGTYQINCVAY